MSLIGAASLPFFFSPSQSKGRSGKKVVTPLFALLTTYKRCSRGGRAVGGGLNLPLSRCMGRRSRFAVVSQNLLKKRLSTFFVLQIILNSMHRFQPRIYLVIRPEHASGPILDLEKEFYRSYIFPETIFTAVTAYQNQLVRFIHLHREETFG